MCLTKKLQPSSEWRFHQDIYVNKKDAKAIVHAQINMCYAYLLTRKIFLLFTTWLQQQAEKILNAANMQLLEQKLSTNIIKVLKEKRLLIANHGQVAFGENLDKTFELAQRSKIFAINI